MAMAPTSAKDIRCSLLLIMDHHLLGRTHTPPSGWCCFVPSRPTGTPNTTTGTTMKTSTFITGLVLASTLATHSTALGNHGDRSVPARPVRRDLVGPGFGPVANGEIVLMREVRRTDAGYEVKVKAADGTLRMRGTYMDEALTIGHGTFSYYHDNGRLESQGRMSQGTKTGVWSRFDREGRALSEKIYDGKTYDQRTVDQGWSAPSN